MNLTRKSNVKIVSLTCLAFVAATGCSDDKRITDRKTVFPVAGQFTAGDIPATGAMISFHPVNSTGVGRALPSQARADDQGRFELTTYVTKDGAPAGEYIVTIYWPESHPKPITEREDDGEGSELPPDRLRGRFASPATSTLRARVTEKSTTFDAFDLNHPSLSKGKASFLTAP
jgi:hypothetical protein